MSQWAISKRVNADRLTIKRLTEAGMPEEQADTLASENLLLIAEHLATKDDLKALQSSFVQLRTEMDAKLGTIEAKFEAMDVKLDAFESRIVTKLGVLMAAMVGTVAAFIKFL